MRKRKDYIKTVGELVKALKSIPPNTPLCSGKLNDHGEYVCDVQPFRVAHCFSDLYDDIGVCYVGIDFEHLN